MNSARPEMLLQLVDQVRNRLWLAASLRWMNRALWLSALLLLLLGLVHLTLLPVAPLLAITALLLPLTLTLLFTLGRQRPDLPTACQQADRLAAADSLLLSAWDLLSRSQSPPVAAPLVIDRALARVSAWQVRLDAIRLAPIPRSAAPAAAVALIGSSLFLFPAGTDNFHPSVPLAVTETASEALPRSTLAEIIQAIDARPENPATPTLPPSQQARGKPHSARQNPVNGAGTDPDAHGAAETAATDTADPLFSYRQAPSPQTEDETRERPDQTAPDQGLSDGRGGGNGQDIAGDNPGESGAEASVKAAALAINSIGIERLEGNQAAAASVAGSGLSTAGRLPPTRTIDQGPEAKAEWPGGIQLLADFTPAERGYLVRYFQRLQHGSKQ